MAEIHHWGGDLAHPPVLVGEDNPYGGRPGNALYPSPPGSAGHRLCVKIFGMDPRQYMLAFLRYNLCTGKWDKEEAERRASGLMRLYSKQPIVLLGAKVAQAFGFEFLPFHLDTLYCGGTGSRILILPHPSGRCRAWNAPGAYERARDALEEVLR